MILLLQYDCVKDFLPVADKIYVGSDKLNKGVKNGNHLRNLNSLNSSSSTICCSSPSLGSLNHDHHHSSERSITMNDSIKELLVLAVSGSVGLVGLVGMAVTLILGA